MIRSLAIGITLPGKVKKSITQLCYGLPSTDWVDEENLYAILHQCDYHDGNMLLDIQEALSELYFPTFEITLQGIGHSYRKNSSGSLWISLLSSTPLEKLSREISKAVKPHIPQMKGRTLPPHIPLASYNKLAPEKLALFLESHAFFTLSPFRAENICLLTKHITSKKIFYTEEELYPLLQ